jgi:hypothetical protein
MLLWQYAPKSMVKAILIKISKILVRAIYYLLCVMVATIGIIYLQTEVYDFPKTSKFEGKYWYNPYQNIDNTTLKANFHAHTKAWAGLSNGHDSPLAFGKDYESKKYDIGGISNYFSTSEATSGLPIYEQGFNFFKRHLLAIGSKQVQCFDYPLWQNSSQMQQIINRRRGPNTLIALAHPSFFGGRSAPDMQQLVGYNFVEILSYYSNSLSHWDQALCQGQLVWLLVNDDSHNLKTQPLGKHYTRIYANNNAELMASLKMGRHYGVKTDNINTESGLEIKNLTIVDNNILHYNFGKNALTISIIADGKLWKKLSGLAGNIKLPDAKTSYIRFEVEGHHATLYTNPIVRQAGTLPILAANKQVSVNIASTIWYKAKVLLGMLFLMFFLVKIPTL